MKTLLFVVAAALFCVLALAQDTTPPSGAAPQDQQSPAATPSAAPSSMPSTPVLRIAPGTVIPVQLTKTIDAKKAKSGDEVQAKVTGDMKNQSGEVLVPKDTKVLGHITEARPRSKEQPQSEVGIAFDHAVVKDKGDVPLSMSIQAIIGRPNLNSPANDSEAAPGPDGPQSSSRMGGTPSAGRSSTTPSGGQTPMPASPSGASAPAGQSAGSALPPITATTQGVVGISNLKLAAAASSTQSSTVSSEKDNVKLESGTFMLLRVIQ